LLAPERRQAVVGPSGLVTVPVARWAGRTAAAADRYRLPPLLPPPRRTAAAPASATSGRLLAA